MIHSRDLKFHLTFAPPYSRGAVSVNSPVCLLITRLRQQRSQSQEGFTSLAVDPTVSAFGFTSFFHTDTNPFKTKDTMSSVDLFPQLAKDYSLAKALR